MVEMRQMFIGFLIVATFIVALIVFGSKFQEENSASMLLINDQRINVLYSGVNNTIYEYGDDGIQGEASNLTDSFNTEDPSGKGTLTELFFSAVTGIAKGIMGIGNAIFNATWNPLLKALGLPRDVRVLVGTILTTILLFTITLLAWKLYKQGQ